MVNGIARGFFETAKENFISAKILHEKEQYPNTIFHLQQGVENIVKSYALYNGIVDVNKLHKQVSHNPKKVFNKQITLQGEMFNQLYEIEKVFPGLSRFEIDNQKIDIIENCKETKKSFKKIIYLNPKDFKWISDRGFDKIKEVIASIEIEPEINFSIFREKFSVLFNEIIQHIEKVTEQDLGITKKMIEDKQVLIEMEEIAKSIIPIQMKVARIYIVLLLFSLLTSEHNQSTRYPCTHCGKSPKDNYSSHMILVKRYDEVHEIIMETVTLFEEIFVSN